MNPGTVSAFARTGVLALVIALAAALGLVVGDAIRDRDGSTLNAGNPAGWAGGAAVPLSRTANASFSLDAITAVAATRDTSASTAAAEEYPDYPLRHAAVAAEDYPDYPLRHPAAPQRASKASPSGPTLR